MMKIEKRFSWILGTIVLSLSAGAVPAGTAQRETQAATTQVRQTLALTYPEGPTIGVEFAGTYRLPRANGEAKVERKKGMTEIEIELDEMKPAGYFGGDYNTYVLWVVSPEGEVDNLGEFILKGNRSKLNVSTTLETFGMFVTAEPHFLVEFPSRFVVMENTRPREDIAPLKVSTLTYEGFDGVYQFENESLANMQEADGEVRSHVEAARTAVELAERAGAEEHAPGELQQARDALHEAEGTVDRSGGIQMLGGHEAIRLAVDARKLAEKRAYQAELDRQRAENAEQIAGLERSIEEARTDAERARLEAERRALDLEMAREARFHALEEARRLAAEKQLAESSAREAEVRAAQARDQLRQAMGELVDIRQSSRGLILSLPDILFDFDKTTLKPQAREILSRLAGILSVTRGFELSVEGHTDSIGSDEYNQRLALQRAESVRFYLLEAGVENDLVSTESYGENRPIASNDNEQGRQQNRRVEIVVEEDENFGTLSSR